MSDEHAPDPRYLTFSQAQGYEELPRPLKLEELNDDARARLWSLLYFDVSRKRKDLRLGRFHLGGEWPSILGSLHISFHNLPLDEFDMNFERFVQGYKPFFLTEPFFRVFDLLQAIMRHRECPRDFTQAVAQFFEHGRLAYVVDTSNPVTIYPAATREEGEAVLQATSELCNAGPTAAVSHLRQASECINQGDHPGAVRESIHAVESTARNIDPNAKTLGRALKSLEGAGAFHPALKQAFLKLYGYTSDEQGIRHALIDNPQPNVSQDEAVFMLGACASFSSYLARKHQRQTS